MHLRANIAIVIVYMCYLSIDQNIRMIQITRVIQKQNIQSQQSLIHNNKQEFVHPKSKQQVEMGTQGSSILQNKLGNPFFASNSSSDQEINTILSEFSLVSTYQDDLFKRCSIIKHKQTQQLIIAKEMDCHDQKQMNKLHQEFLKRKQTMVQENLVRLRYVIKKKADGIFNDEYKLLLFFDYVLVDLQTQYINRKQKSKPFTAQEINVIMAGTIRGYAALQKLKIPNDKVRLNNIYFGLTENNLTITKVIDSSLFPTSTNLQAIKLKEKTQSVYLAPEQLRFINEGTPKCQKAGVYSLGMTLVQVCLLQSSTNMYTYGNKSINYAELQTRLNIIKNKYPLSVFYIIRQMLERNEDSRLTFAQLAQKLPTNIKIMPTNIQLSVMKPTFDTKFSHITKVKNPIMESRMISPTIISRSQRKMQTTTLASQYRPPIDASQVYTNGNRYEGQKRDNLRHGKGKYIYSDGSYYFGDWVKGKMQCNGQLFDCEGNLEYEGEWRDDHFEGKGKFYNHSGSDDWFKYEGEFRAGNKEGFGELFYRDGNRYKGQFRNNLLWGQGRMFGKNGQIIKTGVWEKGVFISQL